jgi:hypothetical protein
MSENLVSKISVATVYGKIKTIIKTIEGKDGAEDIRVLEAPVMLMRIIGHATGFEVKTSQYGDSLKFSGIFKAVNLETGEVYRSGACFLPSVMEQALGGILDQVEGGAEFALDVGAIPAKNAFGYEYRVRPLLETAETPVLKSIEDRIGGLLAIAAPVAAEAASDKPATKGKK